MRPRRKPRLEISRLRIFLIVFCLLGMSGAIVWRLSSLQIVQHEELNKKAQSQYFREIKIPSRRGAIYDTRGEVLAVSIEKSSIYVHPNRFEKTPERISKLAELLDMPVRELNDKLQNDAFAWLRRKAPTKTWENIRRCDLFKKDASLGAVTEYERKYTKGYLAGSIVGNVNLDDEGISGAEQKYDGYLRGAPRRLNVEKYPSGETAFKPAEFYEEPTTGKNIKLTIDSVIQYYADETLANILKQRSPRAATAVVMDPATGAILAMSSFSRRDLIRNNEIEHRTRNFNPAIQDAYEPGSTLKIFVVASALEEGLLKAHDTIFCENGSIRVGRDLIRDHKPFGTLSISEVIAYSSNVGAIKVAGRFTSKDTIYKYLKKFGFGSKTGVDLPGESVGILRKPSQWSKRSQASIAIGQEISVSALQLARAVCAIANGGYLVTPYVLEEIASNGEKLPKIEIKRIISEKTALTVTEMMKEVVEYGTGKRARVEGWTAAGKTGTAQKIDSTGTYAKGKYVAIFAGFLPAEDPDAVIVILIDEPKGVEYHGGEVAAPYFAQLARAVMLQRAVPPSTDGGSLIVASNPRSENYSSDNRYDAVNASIKKQRVEQ